MCACVCVLCSAVTDGDVPAAVRTDAAGSVCNAVCVAVGCTVNVVVDVEVVVAAVVCGVGLCFCWWC